MQLQISIIKNLPKQLNKMSPDDRKAALEDAVLRSFDNKKVKDELLVALFKIKGSQTTWFFYFFRGSRTANGLRKQVRWPPTGFTHRLPPQRHANAKHSSILASKTKSVTTDYFINSQVSISWGRTSCIRCLPQSSGSGSGSNIFINNQHHHQQFSAAFIIGLASLREIEKEIDLVDFIIFVLLYLNIYFKKVPFELGKRIINLISEI